MLVTLWNVDSFGKVATLYESIKPLVSKCHTRDQDIRPIGDRTRKHERIKKINDNCYVLMDGYYTGDDVFRGWSTGNAASYGVPTEAEIIKLAPIVWRKHRDGSTTIKVRNGSGRFSHNARYAFLNRCLPRGLGFSITYGKQYVHCAGARHYLAKSNTVAAHALPKGKRSMWDKHYTAHDDGAALTFRIKDGEIRYHSGGKAKPIPDVQRIDKVSKTKMKPHLDKFRQWTFTMAALWDFSWQGSRVQMQTINRVTEGWCKRHGRQHRHNLIHFFAENPNLCKEIIRNENHELRAALGYTVLYNTNYNELIGLQPDHWIVSGTGTTQKSVKQQYNAQINKVCGFIKIKKGKR